MFKMEKEKGRGRGQMEFCPLSEIIPFCVGMFKAVETQFKFIICPLSVNWKFLGYRGISTERKESERNLLFIILVKCFTVSIDVRPNLMFFTAAAADPHCSLLSPPW